MPLSEDEQRILQDIERSFYENDPAFAKAVSSSAIYKHASRNCKIAVGTFALSLVVLLATFTSTPIVAFLGFVGMLASAGFFVQNLRRIGSVGLRDAAESDKARQVNDSLSDARQRFRKHLRRED